MSATAAKLHSQLKVDHLYHLIRIFKTYENCVCSLAVSQRCTQENLSLPIALRGLLFIPARILLSFVVSALSEILQELQAELDATKLEMKHKESGVEVIQMEKERVMGKLKAAEGELLVIKLSINYTYSINEVYIL